jgi:conjugal transfer/type IV secretion protein DotA/TraY
MRAPLLILFTLALLVIAGPAFAQSINPYDVSWAALDPGNDWAAQVLRSIFPIPGGVAGTSTGNEATVIQQLVGQFTGFVAAIACAFVAYSVIMNIHRAAETSRVLGNGQTWMFAVRVGFAGIMMFPLGGGFSAGQAMVMQGAMVGIGMAKAVYTNVLQAIGPDHIVIAMPMIPGTEKTVEGLIESELCMDLVNLASNTTSAGATPLIPIPQPVTVNDSYNSGYITYRYDLSAGNTWGTPTCGTVTVREQQQTQQTVAGANVDMAAVQQAVLNNVLTGSIRGPVATVAQNFWNTRQASALVPLQTVLSTATSSYASSLTSAASAAATALTNATQNTAGAAHQGNEDLLTGQVQQSTLGWTAAGAYYLEIARLNANTMSLMNATPVTTSPSYDGLGSALSYDMAPMAAAIRDYMTTMQTIVQTSDGTSVPSGIPHDLGTGKGNPSGPDVLDRVMGALNLNAGVLTTITGYILPTTSIWTDPFGGLMSLGQTLINTSLAAMGLAAVLNSGVASTGAALFDVLTFNWTGAAATVAGHAVMSFLATPIFAGLLALLIPGIIIAYVLPMIPYVMWMAGVCGWIILVCEAMIAVPLWMLAHMTFGGDGLHGRAIEGWGLLFNVVFRPVLMLVGLFLGYFVFDCMSWLIRESFGIAAGFPLDNGWLVTNFVGMGVLLSIFVMMHVVAALTSFRLVALLPHHLPRLLGFTAANRVDSDDFQNRAAWGIGGTVANVASEGVEGGTKQLGNSTRKLRAGTAGYIAGSAVSAGAVAEAEGMDSTLRATTDASGEGESDG